MIWKDLLQTFKQSFQLALRCEREPTWLTAWSARVIVLPSRFFVANQGKCDDAEPLFKRALAIREETLGPRHPDFNSEQLGVFAGFAGNVASIEII